MTSSAKPCCAMLQSGMREADAEQLAAAFKALADPARLRVLNFIAAQPDGEACVCHFTDLLGLAQPTVSHHLRLLYEAGLVDRERRGTWVYYRIVAERIAALRGALATAGGRRARPLTAPPRRVAAERR